MAEEEYVYCPDCKLRSYIKDHRVWNQKDCARKWLQTHCPRGIKRGCSTRLSNAEEVRKAQRRKMAMFSQKARAEKMAKKRAAS